MNWDDIFVDNIINSQYYKRLEEYLDREYSSKTIFPSRNMIFNAFSLTPFEMVKVVIVGQDPYHEKGQAMGLSFSVPEGIVVPPSLKNIYKEIEQEFGSKINYLNGDLTYLAKQGVLLLNPILTVVEHQPLSHKIDEYDLLFKDILKALEKNDNPIVYLLWGTKAKKYACMINNINHLVLMANHPSPLSANRGGWFGSNIFIKCNIFLTEKGVQPINWINS